ncbi:hypothetical protein FHG87_022921 [Trinorchestia longiramus]|nr:hypothetical protein FHG87_022921 [Trinorchestia longiramus]
MVFGVVSSEGHIMPPHFLLQVLRVNANAYVETLQTNAKPWVDSVANRRAYVFQQDSVPSHKALKTQDWMTENLHDHVTPNLWPPNSPDLNSLAYYVWGVIGKEVNKAPRNTKSSLMEAIARSMEGINKDYLVKACSRFRTRIESVIEAEGGYIE